MIEDEDKLETISNFKFCFMLFFSGPSFQVKKGITFRLQGKFY